MHHPQFGPSSGGSGEGGVGAPDFTRPPPFMGPGGGALPSQPGPTFPPEGIEPKAPYFDPPAGLMVPLVKIDDREYKVRPKNPIKTSLDPIDPLLFIKK